VITAVNGTPVKDARELARTVATMAPNTTVKLDVLRDGQSKQVDVKLATMPNEQQEANAGTDNSAQTAPAVPHLGLSVAPASQVSGAGALGVVVTGVDPNGPAAEQGFKTGNIILDVGGKAVSSVGDVRKALEEAKAQGKHDVLMRVKAGDATHFVAMPIGNA
jgi:serine protease Do